MRRELGVGGRGRGQQAASGKPKLVCKRAASSPQRGEGAWCLVRAAMRACGPSDCRKVRNAKCEQLLSRIGMPNANAPMLRDSLCCSLGFNSSAQQCVIRNP